MNRRLRCKKLMLALMVLLFAVIAGTGAVIVRHVQGNSHYSAALQALEERDFSQASLCLERYLQLRPRDEAARLLAAQTARRRGGFDEADRLLEICEQNSLSKHALKLERDLIRIQKGDLSDANSVVEYCDDHPSVPETSLILEAVVEGGLKSLGSAFASGVDVTEGEAALYLKVVQQALALWRERTSTAADRVQGLIWSSRTRGFANDKQKALADIRLAVELAPDHFEARLQLAALAAQESPKEAATHLEALHRQQPGNSQVSFALASACRRLGRFEEARVVLDELLAANSQDCKLLLERGRISMDAGQTADAELWFFRALTLKPNDPEANLALSHCLVRAGKIEEAKHYQAQAAQMEAERKREIDLMRQKRRLGAGQ